MCSLCTDAAAASAFMFGYKRLELGEGDAAAAYTARYERIRRDLQQQRVEHTVGVRGQNKVSSVILSRYSE
jgi:hypothetical protein